MYNSITCPLRLKPDLAVLMLVFICLLGNASVAQTPLYIDPNGNVGIGTNKPLTRLHTIGNSQLEGRLNVIGNSQMDGSLNVNGQLSLNRSPSASNAPLTIGNATFRNYFIQDQVTQLGYQWNPEKGNDVVLNLTDRSGNSGMFDLSIYATGGIMGRTFYAFSDARVKTNIVLSNAVNDLVRINKLKVSDYQYKDQIAHGTSVYKGFIAQEVEQVFPEAVSRHADFLPDIFAKAVKVTVVNKTLNVSLKMPHHLSGGDKVRLIVNGTSAQDAVVAVTDANTFTVENWNGPVNELFVYGKQVSDFRTVDYQQIFSLGISGIQELSREITALRNENLKLSQENAANKKLLLDIQVRLQALEERNK
ncbi:tail fiber domain-containing protein [Chitinophaga eiseniae]|uniref:Tail fiber domain-containing protein n=1 Tax=Chitinophaga eiseniae TaxID=634771 RepID=A0A847SMW5_9BACT|nr:tail fiber domain-containing protein [Chitinophaga eiseniae]NLR77302.1 tail fiber domain-containing protein [Chitinophaga eiseniae]